MMVLFRNRIIYMPSMPTFVRGEKIVDYEAVCWPVVWREERVRSGDWVGHCFGCGGGEWRRQGWKRPAIGQRWRGRGMF